MFARSRARIAMPSRKLDFPNMDWVLWVYGRSMITFRNLLRCRGSIGRGAYFAIGATLLVLKFAVDWTVSRLAFQRAWSPVEYFAPGSSLALLFSGSEHRGFYFTML